MSTPCTVIINGRSYWIEVKQPTYDPDWERKLLQSIEDNRVEFKKKLYRSIESLYGSINSSLMGLVLMQHFMFEKLITKYSKADRI